jgi:starvation-inducible DNA-binding protein
MNEELVHALKVVLADHYSVYFKAQGFHWNVESDDFPQYHDFYAMIYGDAIGAVDMIAENIRKLGSYAPFKMGRLIELSTVVDGEVGPDPDMMNADLLNAINAAIMSNMNAFTIANGAANEPGIANDLAGRDGQLKKMAWQLRSTLKD